MNMSNRVVPDHLPLSLYKFFWDVDASKVNPVKSAQYVINRLLDKGDLEAVRWILHTYPRESIKETLKHRLDFSPKTAVFWSRYLSVPREEVKCMQEPYYSLRRQHWQY